MQEAKLISRKDYAKAFLGIGAFLVMKLFKIKITL